MNTQLGESLHQLMHSYRNQLRIAALEAGIKLPICQIRSLKCINSIEHCNASDISNQLMLDKSQVARVLKELVNEGLISKAPCPTNHRSQRLNLTSKGEKTLLDIRTLDQHAAQTMTQNMTEKQINDFIALTSIMLSNLR
ncbi:MarR family transcriptional regulator [Marinomonas sp. A79]|uniref:MarR family transcriptional regulator n=1 Tax=Marinomonas vulgaris TaxID=2823372 RepID=A0ABS5H9X5_9GAMM|nr:MarR family transcriptional regulator [Marinomonas vulgaris]MBR7888478.1 MarR family transcriptional regulator [Marinomonas vulgaris]